MTMQRCVLAASLGLAPLGAACSGFADQPTVTAFDEPPPRGVDNNYVGGRSGYVRVRGRWERRDGGWSWQEGFWIPERPNFQYVQGRWVRARNNWSWVPGHWQRTNFASARLVPTQASAEK
jgi:hypothetical protein